MSAANITPLPPDLLMLERGWLSSNSLLMRGRDGGAEGAVIVDTGYCTHAEQTSALVRGALKGQPLRSIVNTHLHSDHCGGNARLAAEHGCRIVVPSGEFDAARDWDPARLSFAMAGQRCERFDPTEAIAPGGTLEHGGRCWQALGAPGHDPHSLVLFEPELGLLLSADALWERGFGIVFPEIEGESGFDEVEATLDLIAALPVRLVMPGHVRLFSDVAGALAQARSRLAQFRSDPVRHARHAARALIVFHLLEVGPVAVSALQAWLDATPIHGLMWERFFKPQPLHEWTRELLTELAQSAAITVADGIVGTT